jgi:FlaA1/EpsC-like NDP-sugar epimerase
MKYYNKNPFGLRIRYLLLIDLLCILAAITFGFVIRYESLLTVWPYLRHNWTLFVLVPLVRLPLYFAFQLYRRLWRYASTQEFKIIVLAGLLGSLLVYAANFGLLPLLGIYHCPSRSIWVLESGLSVAFLGFTPLPAAPVAGADDAA